MALLLFLLALAGVIAFFIWDYRRKTAARAAASAARFERIFKEQAAAPLPVGSPPAAPAATTGKSANPPLAVVPAAVQEPFLEPTEAAVYLLLKTGVPDHEIFAKVSLAAVARVAGGAQEREQQLRRLSAYRIDFVVCDRTLRIVAAVQLETAGGAESAGHRRFVADCLSAAGIRLVRLSPASLPRRDEIRTLVCGGAAGSAALPPGQRAGTGVTH